MLSESFDNMDQFFAAVELLDHPELKGLPIAVGHDAERGVVSTASYEARRLEKNDFEGRTLTLKVKFEDFQQITRSITVDHILRTKDDILPLAKQLMHSVEYHSHPIRLIGLGVSNQKGTTYQTQPRWIQLELEFKD